MFPVPRKLARLATALALSSPIIFATGCYEGAPVGPDDAPAGVSRAFSAWAPGASDTCAPEIHDKFAVVGVDGKLYPTWHPPVDPETGCSFGHEHGRNPRGSDLYPDVGDIPFGYVNEVADLFAPHVGHKIEWENDVRMSAGFGDVGDALFEIRCDVLVELHQGSAGAGSFIQPMHELVYHARCDGGTELHVSVMSAIGHAGEFVSNCDSDLHIEVAPGLPAGAPDGGGKRRIPTRDCIERHVFVPEGGRSNFSAALRESWQMSQSIRTVSGHRLASIGPYFNVFNPSRYYDPSSPDLVGRPIDLCYEVLENGHRARGSMCEGVVDGLTFDDPRSPFDGAHRDVDINSIRITNADGPEVWYTDVFGHNARREPFPKSIRQIIARVDNEAVTPSGPSIGRDRHYGVGGVHAPN